SCHSTGRAAAVATVPSLGRFWKTLTFENAFPPEIESTRQYLRAGSREQIMKNDRNDETGTSVPVSNLAYLRGFLGSGGRDSNPRQPAWKAGTLPTELPPHGSRAASSRGERTRTSDLSVPNAARYRLRHTPPVSGTVASIVSH
ncbi:MAG: hypothetical protein QOG89_1488, partial [Thermomicrobiales bacterium]|nr:hypothetical protein [Thermomicrobiales bacterium]